MKKGIYIFFGYEMPLKERFRLAKEAGFDSVMIWQGDGTGIYEGKWADYPILSSKYGLSIDNVHLPFLDCNNLWLDSPVGDDYAAYVCTLVTECGRVGVPTAVMHLSRSKTPPPPNKQGLERMKRIIGKAERCNVNISVENIRYAAYLDFVFSQIESPKLRFCFDSGHENCFSRGENLLRRYGNFLSALHINDNLGDEDIHMLPFDGTIDWEATARVFREISYNGVLSLEVHQDRYERYSKLTPEEYLASAYERLQRIDRLIQSGDNDF